MKNSGLFSTLFLEDLASKLTLDDAARGRRDTLAQTWQGRSSETVDGLWDSFLKQAVSYLEFVPPAEAAGEGVYPLYEDWGYQTCLTVLYAVREGEALDLPEVGRFYPAKLVRHLSDRGLTWGILTDGRVWRLYSLKSSRPSEDFVELDLSEALEGRDEDGYRLFERFFHRESFSTMEEGSSCRLDADRKASEEVLEALVKKPFLAQVDEVLQYICNGFIYDTRKTGEEYSEEERKEIFESAVKLIYRALFLFYAEARRLLPSEAEKAEAYGQHSMRVLCEEARKFRWGERQDTEGFDLWRRMKSLTAAVNEGDPEYGIMGYNGGLFDDEEERFLRDHNLRNDFLARSLYLLAYVEPYDNDRTKEYPIPYEDLEVRHLGELYENILEYTVVLADADRVRRRTKKGVEIILASGRGTQPGDSYIKKGEVYFGESALERKQTGSYYTPESLVRFLNEKSITGPLMEGFDRVYRERFESFLREAEESAEEGRRRGAAESAAELVSRFAEEDVLTFSVCDPAMGSGHFLVDAANKLAGVIVSLLAEIPRVEGYSGGVSGSPNVWRRRVTRHCIYGVDLNPLAVNLAKLSLWLNCFAGEHKLTFLDHHMKQGNSLIGLRVIGELKRVPQRKKDKKKDDTATLFDTDDLSADLKEAAGEIAGISAMDEDDTDRQRAALQEAQERLSRTRPLADLYTAYLMIPGIGGEEYRRLFTLLAKGEDVSSSFDLGLPQTYDRVRELADRHEFFHWPLEFPELFGPTGTGGFNATVGNPPWDVMQPNTQEFYVDYDHNFRKYKKQEALKAIKDLNAKYPLLKDSWAIYEKGFKEAALYCKEPAAYRSLEKGKIDLYKAFLERFFRLLTDGGHMGIVVPSGIYTDQGCQPLRELFFEKSAVRFLYGFENKKAIFNIHRSFKFVLFGARKGGVTDRFACAFMEHDPDRLEEIERKALMMRVEQVKKFSPDTLSVMEFKSQRDVDITTKIYGDWPLLGEKIEGTWNVRFRQELNMTSDSHLFKTTPTDHPLYEGKMIWHFDSEFEKPRYWLDKDEVVAALGENAWEGEHYRVGFRDIAASTNERTLISSVLPKVWYGHTLASIVPNKDSDSLSGLSDNDSIWLTAIFSSLVVDFLIRQKVTNHMSFFYLATIPAPRIMKGNEVKIINSIAIRSIRLCSTTAEYESLWKLSFKEKISKPNFWYPSSAPIDSYGPAHEQEIRKRLRDEAAQLTPEWGPHCGVYDRLPDRRDTGDRAQLRAEIDAYVAHLYGLSRDDFTYILDTFPVLKNKEMKAFGEFMSKRKCLEEYDRIGRVLGDE